MLAARKIDERLRRRGVINVLGVQFIRRQHDIFERERIGIGQVTEQLFPPGPHGIKKEHPAFTEKQVKIETIRRCYGDNLANEVAAWKGWKE